MQGVELGDSKGNIPVGQIIRRSLRGRPKQGKIEFVEKIERWFSVGKMGKLRNVTIKRGSKGQSGED